MCDEGEVLYVNSLTAMANGTVRPASLSCSAAPSREDGPKLEGCRGVLHGRDVRRQHAKRARRRCVPKKGKILPDSVESRHATQVLRGLSQDTATPSETQAEASADISAFLRSSGKLTPRTIASIAIINDAVAGELESITKFSDLPQADRRTLRTNLYLVGEAVGKMAKTHGFAEPTAQHEIQGRCGQAHEIHPRLG
jgi:hypothetical protein